MKVHHFYKKKKKIGHRTEKIIRFEMWQLSVQNSRCIMLCFLFVFIWLNIEWGESYRAPSLHWHYIIEIVTCSWRCEIYPWSLRSWVSRLFLKPGAVLFTLNGFWTMVLPHRVHCGEDSWQTLLLQFFGLLNWYVNLFWEETYGADHF